MSSWHTYPKIYNVGHAAVAEIFSVPISVEEKVDGSQFSFGRFDGEYKARSRGKAQYPVTDQMFLLAVEQTKALDLRKGWTYSGELLNRPKHNTLVYGRVPAKNVILFDVRTGEEQYLSYADKAREAARLGLEVVPELFQGRVGAAAQLESFLDRESCLGGCKIEGFVIKPAGEPLFDRAGARLMAKFVSELFKEQHKKTWREDNPVTGDIIRDLCVQYNSEARWRKAAQRLRDDGRLSGEPRDISALVKEAQRDVKEEETDAIKAQLFAYAWPKIQRACVAGLAEWYKRQLLEKAFETGVRGER